MSTSHYRIGVDIGGTFTDAVMIEMESGEMFLAKVPTTPKEPSVGFLNSVERVTKGIRAEEVAQTIHATTIATNAIIEGKVAKGAFVTTRGFRDLLEIQRQIRPKLYDIFFDKPKPLIPRWLSFEITERITPEGEVMTPLSEEDATQVVQKLVEEKVESAAVCFLHSYINPSHEKRVGEIFATVAPNVYVTLSHEISPQFREYMRASTTVINAVLMPIVARYLDRLEADLRSRGFRSELYIMQSSGGLMTSQVAKRKPAYMVESGPAAGTIAAAYVASLMGYESIISFDMGGTTAKVGLVEGGRPKITSSYEVGSTAARELGGLTKGAGYPLRTPVIDLVEVGAGGGSIAWIDSGGALRVGPQSAGADPGPACYLRGGTQPTITDANLVLGRLDPDYFLGGEMKLSVKAAEEAVKVHCASVMGGDHIRAANGILEIANANMLRALRLTSVERGYDPRDFTVVAFGGAGPMHVNALAEELQVGKILIPPAPGLFSALGLLVTDLKHEFVQTYIKNMDMVNLDEVHTLYSSMEDEAIATLGREGVKEREMYLNRSMDVRYVGQSYELPVTVPGGMLSADELRQVREGFYQEHEKSYGHAVRGEPVEIVNLRLTATGLIQKPKLKDIEKGESDPRQAFRRKTRAFFSQHSDFVECDVYDRYRLRLGDVVLGPAIIEERDSTTVLHPGYTGEVNRYGFLLITKSQKPSPLA